MENKEIKKKICNPANSLLIFLCILALLVIWIPMLNMMVIVYTTFLYKKSNFQNKNLDLILKVVYVIAICITLYVLLSLVYFLLSDFIDRMISFFFH